MLTSVKIHRFRSCVNVNLENIDNILVLIGRNGAGKTNVMTAIEWAARIAVHGTNSKQADVPLETGGEVTLYFQLSGTEYSYHIRRRNQYEVDKDNEPIHHLEFFEELCIRDKSNWHPVIRRDDEFATLYGVIGSDSDLITLNISDSTSGIAAVDAFLPEDSAIRTSVAKIRDFFSSIRYYALQSNPDPLTSLVIPGVDYKKWVTQKFSGSASSSVLYKMVYLHQQNKDKFDELLSLVGSDGLGIINEIRVLPFGPASDEKNHFFFIQFQTISNENAEFSFGELSFGTKRMLSLIVSILFDSASVALIEQPEDGIHAGLVDKLTDILTSYAGDSQFIVASHSTSVLNKTNPDRIRIVEIDDGVTKLRPLDDCELKAAKYYLENDGSFSDFLESI